MLLYVLNNVLVCIELNKDDEEDGTFVNSHKKEIPLQLLLQINTRLLRNRDELQQDMKTIFQKIVDEAKTENCQIAGNNLIEAVLEPASEG